MGNVHGECLKCGQTKEWGPLIYAQHNGMILTDPLDYRL